MLLTVGQTVGGSITVDHPVEQDFDGGIFRVSTSDEGIHRTVQLIVLRAEEMAAAVPGEHRLACGVIQDPAVSGIHAVLEEKVSGDVVTRSESTYRVVGLVVRHGWSYVLHHEILAGIADPQRFSFRI